jgi:hypothetical protein
MDRLRQSLPPEPALGSGTLTTLRITFPGGVKVQRRFHSSDTLQVMIFSSNAPPSPLFHLSPLDDVDVV